MNTYAPGRKCKKKRPLNSAFTLIEVIVASCIGAIVFLALFFGIAQGYGVIQVERENLRATQIMLSRMEGLRLCVWGSDQLFNTNIVPTTFTEDYYPSGLGGASTNNIVYSGTMTITPNPSSITASYSPNMALVTVTVSWDDSFYGRTFSHTRTMSTYVAQYGVQNYIYND